MKKALIGFTSGVLFSIIVSSILNFLCNNNKNKPPSKYVGIFQNFNNRDNGDLSIKIFHDKKFSGQWSYGHSAIEILGNYNNGYPSDSWVSLGNLGRTIQYIEIFKDKNNSIMYVFDTEEPWKIIEQREYSISNYNGNYKRTFRNIEMNR